MNAKVLLAAFVCVAFGNATPLYLPDAQVPETPKVYAFAYGVQDDLSGSNFGHQESHDGLRTTGQYRVALPDGRVQTVTYTADENGYVAQVTYEGEARFSEPPTPSNQGSPTPYNLYAPPQASAPTTTTTAAPAPPASDPEPSLGYLPLPLYQAPSAPKQEPARLRLDSAPLESPEESLAPSRTLSLPAALASP
ncbi:cuticle protein 19.8-like [Penaeus indicus]|uniref:cuticle protein 19.8-like n=1 Tax=Penaeus indicus TaxID=29960 RepID=UPI00300C2EAD